MDGSRTGFAELLTPSAVPKFSPSGGSNENELNQDQLGSKNGFKKSPSPKKHFMSPTISAASKAFVPRKKVLAERNQDPEAGKPAHFPKPFNLSPKMSASFSTICRNDAQSCSSAECSIICSTDVQSCSVKIDDSGDQNNVSLKPYDPITNYLSPRPTFLRYNPNRRYQLVHHLENETGQKKYELGVQKGLSFDAKKPTHEEAVGENNYGYSVSCSEDSQGSSVSSSDKGSVGENNYGYSVSCSEDSQGSSVSSSDKGSVEEEDEMIDDFENAGEKINGVDVPKDLSFDTKKPGFEEVLWADTQGSSVSCIKEVSVNDDSEQIGHDDAEDYDINEVVDEEEQEEIEVFEEESGLSLKGVLKISFVIVSLILSTLYISSMNSPRLLNNLEARWGFKDQYHRFQYVVALNTSESASESSIDYWGKTEIGLLKFKLEEVSHGFEGGNAIQDGKKGLVEIIDELGEVEAEGQDVQIEGARSNESGSGEEGPDQLQVPVTAKSKDEVLDTIEEDSDQLHLTDFTQSEGFEYYKMEKAEEDSDKLPERQASEMYENDINSGSASEVEKVATEDRVDPVEEVSNQMLKDEVERTEDIDNNEIDDLNAENVESGQQNPESDSIEFPLGKAKFDSIPAIAIGVPIIFTILASLGVVYYLRRKKVKVEESLSVAELLVEPVLAEKITTSLPSSVEEEVSDGVETFANTSSFFRPVPEGVAKEISHSQSHAPSVELLGELVIGEVSCSLRSRGGAKGVYLVKEEGHYSPSQTSGSSQANATSYLEVSTADLDGSSIAEKKIVEKKGEKEEEESTPVRRGSTTPVRRGSRILPSPLRRSSRLRERSVLS